MTEPSVLTPRVTISRALSAARAEPCVLTIGNFDGVHRGHQAMLSALSALAREHGVAARLLTFEPHPVEFLSPNEAPPRLLRFREKVVALSRYGITNITCARFGETLSRFDPETFVEDVLFNGLAVRHVLVGDDFRFGHRGAGNFETLSRAGERFGFGVSRVDTVQHDGARVSSTRVREALAAGELALAGSLLGRPYAVCGRVRMGQQLGRTIGFPTANIACGRNRFAPAGVFAVRVRTHDGTQWRGVANVGRRPTVDGTEERLEVHLFDVSDDLYGQELEVVFEQRIRGEQKFPNLDALKAQIAADADAARRYFDGTGV